MQGDGTLVPRAFLLRVVTDINDDPVPGAGAGVLDAFQVNTFAVGGFGATIGGSRGTGHFAALVAIGDVLALVPVDGRALVIKDQQVALVTRV